METPKTADLIEQLRSELSFLKRHLRVVSTNSKTLPLSITGLKFDEPNHQLSEPFYTHPCGHKLCLKMEISKSEEKPPSLIVYACLLPGEFDCELNWPVKARVTIQIWNQNGDSDHIQRSKQVSWQYRSVDDPLPIPVLVDIDTGVLMKQTDDKYGVRYIVKDIIQLTVKYMPLQ